MYPSKPGRIHIVASWKFEPEFVVVGVAVRLKIVKHAWRRLHVGMSIVLSAEVFGCLTHRQQPASPHPAHNALCVLELRRCLSKRHHLWCMREAGPGRRARGIPRGSLIERFLDIIVIQDLGGEQHAIVNAKNALQ